jgi:hypothetical protein
MALGLTWSLTKMSTRDLPHGVYGRGSGGLENISSLPQIFVPYYSKMATTLSVLSIFVSFWQKTVAVGRPEFIILRGCTFV